MENLNDKLNIGDYIIANDKHIGQIIQIIWNSNGYIIKLENDDEYLDSTLSQYKLLNLNDIHGHMLLTLNDTIKKINPTQLENLLLNYDQVKITNIVKKINDKYNVFLNNLYRNNYKYNSDSNVKIGLKNANLEKNIYSPYENLYNFNKFPLYNKESGQEENYKLYITNMINELFVKNNKPIWNEDFYIGDTKSIDLLGDENINDIIKPILISSLEKFDEIKILDEINFKNTLMYRHLIYDDNIDMLSLGKQFINLIKKELLEFQKDIKLDDSYKLLESTNLFDFLNFKKGICLNEMEDFKCN
jgi:hypothetical protein